MKMYMLYVFLLVVLLVANSCNTFTPKVKPEKDNDTEYFEKKNDANTEALFYNLYREDFYSFVERVSVDDLKENSYNVFKIGGSASINGKIEMINLTTGKDFIEEYDGGILRVGSVPIYNTLISFISRDGVYNFLKQNGVLGEVKESFVISSFGLPLTICTLTDNGNYFITVDEMVEDFANKPKEEMYVYRLYTPDEYYKKIAPFEGEIVFNENKIVGQAVIHTDLVEIPLIRVLKALGANIKEENRNEVTIFISGKEYLLKVEESSMVELGDTWDYLSTVPGGIKLYRYDDTEVYVDNITIQLFFKELGYRIERNDDYKIINILEIEK